MNSRAAVVALAVGVLLASPAVEALAGIRVLEVRPDHSWIATVSVDTTFNNGALMRSWDRFVLTEVDPSALPFLVLGAPFPSSPSVFEPPTVLSNFDEVGWTQTPGATASTAEARAASVAANINELQFDVHFTGVASDGGAFKIEFYDDVQGLVARGWLYARDLGTNQVQQSQFLEVLVVPLPATVWAGLVTLAGMGAFVVRRRRARRLLA